MDLITYSWLIPLLPILSFAIIILMGITKLEKAPELSGYVALVLVGLSFLLSLGVIFASGQDDFDEAREVGGQVWFSVGDQEFSHGFYVDHLTTLMLLVVTLVSWLVVLYSLGYMSHEGRRRTRYYAEISLFVGVMLGLVMADNFLLLFIFWELVGVCSYLLIGFWYEKPSAASAAKKAFLVTRVGDISFLIGLVILWNTFHTFEFSQLFHLDQSVMDANSGNIKWATLFIFGGAVGKSAQFPLHVWLPDAMEGPTTVSALIHAATMVKAGVYLVARGYPLFVQSPDTMLVVAVIGGLTAFMAAAMALVMYDIKRVLAYSTISQLGYMFLALGAGGYWLSQQDGTTIEEVKGYTAGMFHLMNHAFFKALLFLGAGSVIHSAATQDMREMGGLRKYMPITSLTMGLGVLSIAGFPLFSGFWSKDEILASVYQTGNENPVFYLLWLLGVVTAFMTAFYMARLWFMTFSGQWRGDQDQEPHLHESPRVMTGPLMVLGCLATLSGLIALFGMPHGHGFGNWLHHPQYETSGHFDAGGLLHEMFFDHGHAWMTYLSILMGLGGLAMGYLYYSRGPLIQVLTATPEDRAPARDPGRFTAGPFGRMMHQSLSHRLYLSDLFNHVGLFFFTHVARWADRFDQTVIDGMVNAVSSASLGGSSRLRRIQTGVVSNYASLIVGGMFLLLLTLRVFDGLLLDLWGWNP